MILEDAPGRAEDLEGLPFAGPAGQLLDKMCAAIGLHWREEVYTASVIPWRPPQDREASAAELAMMQPFLRRHITLAAPEVVICMGNISCQAILGKGGLSKLRGAWQEGIRAAGIADGASAGPVAPACAEETGMARFVDAQSLAPQAIRRRHNSDRCTNKK